MHDEDETVYCTGTVTEYQFKELVKRVQSGMTDESDVKLLELLWELSHKTG